MTTRLDDFIVDDDPFNRLDRAQVLPDLATTAPLPAEYVPRTSQTERFDLSPVAVPSASAASSGMPWWLWALGAVALYLVVSGKAGQRRSEW